MIAALLVVLSAPQDAPPPGAAWSHRVPRAPAARHFYAAPDGRPDAAGTRADPWDLASALAGRRALAPGDVLWVRGGSYRGPFDVLLAGTEAAPIHVRAVPGERASILDGGLRVSAPAAGVWIWDLELAGTLPPERRVSAQKGSHPTDLPLSDGLSVRSGRGLVFVNLLIHDNPGNGVGWWAPAEGGELHGCVIYGNGWQGPDRGHGHAIYTQNREPVKTISGCILSAGFDGGYSLHAYGSSRAWVDHYLVEENIAAERGPVLLGGGRPSRGLRVRRNFLFRVPLRIGYSAPENEDVEVRDNLIAGADLSIVRFKTVVSEGNVRELPAARAFLIPNRYDPARAHVAAFNGSRAAGVPLEAGAFLPPGTPFRLLDPRNLHGRPVLEGRAPDGPLSLPVPGEFAAFVLVKEIAP
jgi:hypothetical protein